MIYEDTEGPRSSADAEYGARLRAAVQPGGPTIADLMLQRVQALCEVWDQPHIVWWRQQAAADIFAVLDRDIDISDLRLRRLNVEGSEIVANIVPGGPNSNATLLAMVTAMGDMLHTENPPNYVEFDVYAGDRTYVAHVRRGDRPSPHTLRRQAEARITAAITALETYADQPDIAATRALAALRSDGDTE